MSSMLISRLLIIFNSFKCTQLPVWSIIIYQWYRSTVIMFAWKPSWSKQSWCPLQSVATAHNPRSLCLDNIMILNMRLWWTSNWKLICHYHLSSFQMPDKKTSMPNPQLNVQTLNSSLLALLHRNDILDCISSSTLKKDLACLKNACNSIAEW